MSELDPAALLSAYHDQLRTEDHEPLPAGWRIERDGPVTRTFMRRAGFVSYRSVAGLPPAELDALIARQRDIFAALGQEVEWKWRAYDLPADLPDRLAAAGFQPQERETVLVGLAAPLAATAPDLLTILVAEADGTVVSAGWIRYLPDTEFAGLWGGSTLVRWRRRGIYRALVAARARLALDRGYAYLQVDASDDSRPILSRLGFVALTETVPFVFTPGVPDTAR